MELCKITKTEPRKFWSAVRPKRKTKCVVDNETISKYFENVLGADPPELSEGLHRWDVVEKSFLHYESFVEL
jgi:hypothetical protein